MHTSPSCLRPAFGIREIVVIMAMILLTAATLLYLLPTHKPQWTTRTMAELNTISKGLEMLSIDSSIGGAYPDSSWRQDPISDFPGGTSENRLSGAHWLARAMLGPDARGLDATARCLGPPSDPPLKMADLDHRQPRGPYIEPSKFRGIPADNSTELTHRGDFLPTGRPVLLDPWGHPILYYRAYQRGRTPFSRRGTTQPANDDEELGTYNQDDNARITGSDLFAGWGFLGKTDAKPIHPLGVSGSNDPAHVDDAVGPDGHYSFSSYLHNRDPKAKSRVRPMKDDSYILISAGSDGLYGTEDDITNFDRRP